MKAKLATSLSAQAAHREDREMGGGEKPRSATGLQILEEFRIHLRFTKMVGASGLPSFRIALIDSSMHELMYSFQVDVHGCIAPVFQIVLDVNICTLYRT